MMFGSGLARRTLVKWVQELHSWLCRSLGDQLSQRICKKLLSVWMENANSGGAHTDWQHIRTIAQVSAKGMGLEISNAIISLLAALLVVVVVLHLSIDVGLWALRCLAAWGFA